MAQADNTSELAAPLRKSRRKGERERGADKLRWGDCERDGFFPSLPLGRSDDVGKAEAGTWSFWDVPKPKCVKGQILTSGDRCIHVRKRRMENHVRGQTWPSGIGAHRCDRPNHQGCDWHVAGTREYRKIISYSDHGCKDPLRLLTLWCT
jgi:hypothetical protein